MNEMTRRDFVGLAGAAVSGLYAGCRMPPGLRDAQAAFTWGCLLHLGSNMWDDFDDKGPDGWARSEEEEKANPNPFGPSGKRRSSYHSYLRCHAEDACAEAVVRFCRERIDPSRLKGFYTAPWAMSVPDRIAAKGGNHEGRAWAASTSHAGALIFWQQHEMLRGHDPVNARGHALAKCP